MLTYWKSSEIRQLKVEDEAISQHIQLGYLGYVKMQLVNYGAFQFASVDIV